MDVFGNLIAGFATALSVNNLLYCFIGVLLGTVVGVLPGLGGVTTMVLLLPLTYSMDSATAIIMLAGVYYGSMYGGSTTAILMNMGTDMLVGYATGVGAISYMTKGVSSVLILALTKLFLFSFPRNSSALTAPFMNVVSCPLYGYRKVFIPMSDCREKSVYPITGRVK